MYRWHQLIPVIKTMSNEEYKKQKELNSPLTIKIAALPSGKNSANKTCSETTKTTIVGENDSNNSNKTAESENKNNHKSSLNQNVEHGMSNDNDNGNECVESKDKEDEIDELRLPFKNYVDLLTPDNGLERFLLSASNTPAGKLSLFNTERFLCETAVRGTISKSRFYKLESLLIIVKD